MRAARAISSYGKAAEDPLAAEREAITAQACGARRRRARRDRRGRRTAGRAGRCRRFRRRSSRTDPEATIVAGSTDVGLWVTKHMRRISPAVFIGNLDGLCSHRRRRTASSRIGAGVTYTDAFADAVEAHPGARAAVRPHRRRPGAQHGHDRRQHRQRLADRRHAAAADRARRQPDAADAARSGGRSRSRTSSSPMASRTGSRASSSRPCTCRCRQRRRILPSTRSPSGATRTSPPCSAPST